MYAQILNVNNLVPAEGWVGNERDMGVFAACICHSASIILRRVVRLGDQNIDQEEAQVFWPKIKS